MRADSDPLRTLNRAAIGWPVGAKFQANMWMSVSNRRVRNRWKVARGETMDPVQYRLDRDRVFAELLLTVPDRREAEARLQTVKIRVLGDRTLLDAVEAGDAEKALRYLKSISGGQNG